MQLPRCLPLLCSLPLLLPCAVSADENSEPVAASESELLYVRRVAPLLREKCLACHGGDADEIEGGLDIRTRTHLLSGGDSTLPAVVPGKPRESGLYLAATRDSDDFSAMPPKEAERLDEQQLAYLSRWIETGAAWPNDERVEQIEAEYEDAWSVEDGVRIATSGGLSDDWTNRKYDPASLWAYRPVERPTFTEDERTSGRSPIDILIERQLPEGLEVAPPADRRTLLRRVTYDLTGLPPTPEEVSTFVNDQRSDDDAFAAVVDRLLASPHYGERMAQHWLDVVRYADSSGFANDYERGNAWRYRDYVVRSFNDDTPYDRFVKEQLAGDQLAAPDDPEMKVAVGFLRMGPWELTGMEVPKVARQRFLDDVTNSVGETFLAHALQCARCHDHKFDPVPTRDYYGIQAVFATTQLAERPAEFLPEENTGGFDEQRWLDERNKEYGRMLSDLDDLLLKNADAWFAETGHPREAWDTAVAQAKKNKAGSIFNAARSAMAKRKTPQEQYPPKLVGFTPQEFGMERVARKGMQRLKWEFDRYKPHALSVYDGHTPTLKNVHAPLRVPKNVRQGEKEATAILTGGDPFSPSIPVAPGFLSVVAEQASADIPTTVENRRLAFAEWVADPDNPLTPRVMANRVWLWNFGRGIAGNPNNFGSTGKKPTHPELLDWLASEFVASGWSVKHLQRTILLSDAYRRSSTHPDPESLAKLDPTGTSYAKSEPRRLTAEEIRDSMLHVTGELNPTLGGIPARPEINLEVALQPRQVMGSFANAWVPHPLPERRHRRSLYVLKLRGLMDPLLEVFNVPPPDFSAEQRDASTVTPQAFTLFNGRATHTRALALAQRISEETASDEEAIRRLFLLTVQREPTADEVALCLAHWQQMTQSLPEQAPEWPTPPLSVVREAVEENTGEKFTFEEPLYSNREFVPDVRPEDVDKKVRALSDVCLVLLNSNEFVYVY